MESSSRGEPELNSDKAMDEETPLKGSMNAKASEGRI